MKNNVTVQYEKFYTDDVGKHLGNIFGKTNINIKSMWEDVIDGFFQYDFTNNFACLHGDVRIVVANEEENNTFKFNQYFISSLDGKIIIIKPDTWFAIHNLGFGSSIIINYNDSNRDSTEKKMSNKIFNWYSKR